MKVLLIPSSVEAVGVATHVLNLARLLRDADMLEAVLCPADGWLAKELDAEGLPFEIVKLSYKPSRFVYSNIRLFYSLIRRKSAGVVHFHGRFPLLVALLSMIMFRGRRFVVTVHQFAATGNPGVVAWKNRLEVLVWRHLIWKVCCVSEALGREVRCRLGVSHADKVEVIQNWISPVNRRPAEYERTLERVAGADLKIIGLGRLSPEKGFDVLVEAVRILVGKGFYIRCDIFGDGPEGRALTELISRYGLEDYVKLAGHHENIRSVLPNYNAIVIPSRMESFGIVALEAYEAEVPVIASNVPGLNEVVEDRVTGLLFNAEDSYHLAEQVNALVCNAALGEALVRQGKRFMKTYMEPGARLHEYERFYGQA